MKKTDVPPQLVEAGKALYKEHGYDSRENVMFWYLVSYFNRFKTFSKSYVNLAKKIVKEISLISERVPLHMNVKSYKPGEIAGICKDLELMYVLPWENNMFFVRVFGRADGITPIQLVALYQFLMNVLTHGQIENMAGFETLKLAKNMSKQMVKTGG